jgi:hypothetical protein
VDRARSPGNVKMFITVRMSEFFKLSLDWIEEIRNVNEDKSPVYFC